MDKNEFITVLRTRLRSLPKTDVDRSIEFYTEMIDERIEEGLSEEEAVAALGDVENVVAQILSETSFTHILKAKLKPKRPLRTWEIVCLIVGSPIWLGIPIVLLSVVVALYASIWAVVISLYAVALALAVIPVVAVVNLFISIFSGQFAVGLLCLGIGVVCAGLSVLMFYGCNACVKGAVWIGKKMWLGLKRCIFGRRAKK